MSTGPLSKNNISTSMTIFRFTLSLSLSHMALPFTMYLPKLQSNWIGKVIAKNFMEL